LFFVSGILLYYLDRLMRIARWVLRGQPGARSDLANPPFDFATEVINSDAQNRNMFLELLNFVSQFPYDLLQAGHVWHGATRCSLGRWHRRRMLAEYVAVVKALHVMSKLITLSERL
jgi:hypothetical protein